MALSRNVYRSLEDVVSLENVSEDPAMLQVYAFQPFGARGGVWTEFTPEAVVLPGSAEEVQAIVKICNRHKIKFKALSTGWGAHNAPGVGGVVQLDLRRMNRILEIDEKNMYAVVEPYVICAQLQVEAMKRGLNCHIIGAGSSTSALASATSVVGYGPDGLIMGFSGRNVLGVEWVLPTGEILKLGSLGSGAGWFCGDGPGPSLRGIMRGWEGAWGGLGVFTKCAVKLYHWPGPPTIQMKTTPASYVVETPLEDFKISLLSFPNLEKLTEAAYKIGEAEIGWWMARLSPSFTGLQMARGKEFYDLWKTGMLQEMLKYALALGIHGKSRKEFEYQKKALDEILAETGGVVAPVGETPEMQSQNATSALKIDTVTRSCFRPGGGFNTSFGAMDAPDLAITQIKKGTKIKEKYIKRGLLMDDGADNCATLLFENGALGYTEVLILFDHRDPESLKGAWEYLKETNEACIEYALGVPIFQLAQVGGEKHGVFGPACSNYHIWLRKIKRAFDPNNACDPTAYISPEEPERE